MRDDLIFSSAFYMFKWRRGRLRSKYYVKTFFSLRIIDCHLIKIPKGGWIPLHKDRLKGKRVFRLNFHFGSFTGGLFICKNVLFRLGQDRVVLFRPDEVAHKVAKVSSGAQYIFSLGLAL